ncbi:MAG: acetolactate decarboxylase [Chlamydiales bacterium]|nr:acetolactate decarboxylase [Chlamydiales bacterium]
MIRALFLLLIPLLLSANELYQVSTYSALVNGVYDGTVLYRDLFKKGDFGLGTFNGIDGEMIALDGKYYQGDPSGLLTPVRPSQKTPFAAVIFFKPEFPVQLNSAKDFKHLGNILSQFIHKKNTPHAIKIEGSFRYVKIRNLEKTNPPYKPLKALLPEQHDVELYDTEGTLVGFWFPRYLKGINVGGYHFHYIDEKKQSGGHVLDVSLKRGMAYYQLADSLTIDYPNTKPFDEADL